MKVGIITQPLMHNIGGILQNFALQTVIMDLGHTPITIDYDTCLSLFRCILSNIRHTFTDRQFIPIVSGRLGSRLLNEFIIKNINTLPIPDFKPISTINWKDFDAIIVGSDQVWRSKYSSEEQLLNKYLNFIPTGTIKKIAYAVSFGTDNWEYSETLTYRCKKSIVEFDAVSFREQSAVRLCKQFFGIISEQVLDPTMLLTETYWRDFARRPFDVDGDYVFAYILDNEDSLRSEIDEFTKSKGLKVIYLSAYGNLLRYYTPAEWVWLIDHAKYVVTDSFHCSVYSYLLQKQFITIVNKSRGITRYRLFYDLGVGDRISDKFEKKILQSPVDYNSLPSISQKRQQSLEFLRKALS